MYVTAVAQAISNIFSVAAFGDNSRQQFGTGFPAWNGVADSAFSYQPIHSFDEVKCSNTACLFISGSTVYISGKQAACSCAAGASATCTCSDVVEMTAVNFGAAIDFCTMTQSGFPAYILHNGSLVFYYKVAAQVSVQYLTHGVTPIALGSVQDVVYIITITQVLYTGKCQNGLCGAGVSTL